MTQRIEITHAQKRVAKSSHSLGRICGLNEDGSGWCLLEAEAIAGIESGNFSFYIRVEETELDVRVHTVLGKKSLTATPGRGPDNWLFRLPEEAPFVIQTWN